MTRTPELDALVDEARTMTDFDTRFDLYRQVREIVGQDAPLVFAHYETINYLMRKNVCGSLSRAGHPGTRLAR